jgi:tetratricopeptide (TPR) repeat protein
MSIHPADAARRRRARWLVCAVAAVLAAGVVATPAHAQRSPRQAEDADTRRAEEHFVRGEKLFALGRFADALAAYEAAFEAKALPEFLFNIGQCHRNMGDFRSAVFSFRKYLNLLPDAHNRAAVEALIAELEAEMAAADQARRTGLVTDPGAGQPAARRPVYKRWWFWAGLGVAAAAGTTGAVYATGGGALPGSDLGNVSFDR